MDTRTRHARTRAGDRRCPTNTLQVENLQKRYGSRTVVKDVSLTVAKRRSGRAARSQRCGQDHLLLHGGRPGSARRRQHRAERDVDRPPADPPARANGAVVPAAGSLGLPQADGRGKHPRGARTAARRAEAAAAACAGRRSVSTSCSTTCRSRTCAPIRRCRCPAANGGASRSHAHSPRVRASSCSTSRSPGVDPIAVLEIQRIVRFLKERGIGVLITDHNVRETLGICDHAYIINEGVVLAAGRPGRDRRQRDRAPRLPGRTLPHVGRSAGAPPPVSLHRQGPEPA